MSDSNRLMDAHDACPPGMRVVVPDVNEVLIDIDRGEDVAFLDEQLALLNEFVSARITSRRPSKSGLPKQHVRITLSRPLREAERLALQACLGSDRKRELLGLMRLWHYPEQPISCFFERAEEAISEHTDGELSACDTDVVVD